MCDLIKILILQIQNEKLSCHSIELVCFGCDMSLGRKNMKLKIMSVFNTSKLKKGIGLWGIFCNGRKRHAVWRQKA